MKKSKNLLIGIGIIGALFIGFLIGIAINYPKVNNQEVSGTIGRINNYRNTKVSEADIQLKNELLSDSTKLKMLQSYLNFYYVSAVKMAGDVDLAVKEANAVDVFHNTNKIQLAKLNNYGNFLFSARTDLFLALSACQSAKETDPILLRNLLNQANNVITQINYRDRIVLDFVDVLSTFIQSNKTEQYPGLEQTHDLLAVNELYTSLITKDKMVLRYLDKTSLFSKSDKNLKGWDQTKLNSMIQQDMEKLMFFASIMGDAEKMASFQSDFEKLKSMTDANQLNIILILDNEKLNSFDKPMTDALALFSDLTDANKLAITLDFQKLGMFNDNIQKLGVVGVFDAESLGLCIPDAQKLGSVVADAEKLSMILISDTEKLGVLSSDTEKLGVFDVEKLSGHLFDAEKLGMLNAEMLGSGVIPGGWFLLYN